MFYDNQDVVIRGSVALKCVVIVKIVDVQNFYFSVCIMKGHKENLWIRMYNRFVDSCVYCYFVDERAV